MVMVMVVVLHGEAVTPLLGVVVVVAEAMHHLHHPLEEVEMDITVVERRRSDEYHILRVLKHFKLIKTTPLKHVLFQTIIRRLN